MGKQLTPEERHEEYMFFKERGICPVCRKRSAAIGRTQCEECLERSRDWSARRDKDVQRFRRKEAYEQHKADGICVSCKCRPAIPGKVRCDVCTRKSKIYAVSHYVRNVKPSDVCWRKNCSEPTVNGTRYCQAHYQQMVEHARMMRDTAKGRGTWRGWDNRWLFTPI